MRSFHDPQPCRMLRESDITRSSGEAIINSYRHSFASSVTDEQLAAQGKDKKTAAAFHDDGADEKIANTRDIEIAERRMKDLQRAPSSKSPRLLIKETHQDESSEVHDEDGLTVEKLFSCLHGEMHVRVAAAKTLRDASCPSGPPHFAALRSLLHTPKYKVLAIQHAIDVLQGEDESTKESALGIVQFLANRGDRKVIGAMLGMLTSPSCPTELRGKAARTLSNLAEQDDADVISAVSSLLQTKVDANVPVKVEAVHLIAEVCSRGHPPAVKIYQAALRDRSSAVRQEALSMIASIVEPGDSQIIAMVSALIKDSDPRNRVCAVQGLRQIARQGDQTAVDSVLYALKDSNVQVIFRSHGLLANIDKHRLEDVSRQLVLNWKGGKVNECFASWVEHHKQQRRIKESVRRTLRNAKIQIESPTAMEAKSPISNESDAPPKRAQGGGRNSVPSRSVSRRTRGSIMENKFKLKIPSSERIPPQLPDLEERRDSMHLSARGGKDVTAALLDPSTKIQERLKILRSFSGLRQEHHLLRSMNPMLTAAVIANVDSTFAGDGLRGSLASTEGSRPALPKHDKAALNALLLRAQEKDWAVRNSAYKAMSTLGDAHRDWTAIKEIQRIMSSYDASSLPAAKQALFALSVGHKPTEDRKVSKPPSSASRRSSGQSMRAMTAR
ncbi:hypothetical protein GUITHDRAFT_114259 [Guillardia theta CCMP2712]|uniref:TOG domain-containing protein n=1 Tax=Guillardia theta (strain CCMP2712) TaxID=905079 RepID=L1IUJ6_GUITC|nr:hypothetical protein GUITHDRAFT_114259 [Guillardia theta CCMP2712]EKX39762.1 hypothetical protein GUITHDRAFT_114259 [Guillardia theta CCMP2712]|eukprot:XP_005826742.1 hypothetical protein GUITHDRAFT_114259 [Guillardia theta CCMP2712]